MSTQHIPRAASALSRVAALVAGCLALAGSIPEASAHEVMVRGGAVRVGGEEHDAWFGSEPMAAIAIHGGVSPKSFLTITFGWTYARALSELYPNVGTNAYADCYDCGSSGLGIQLDTHRIAAGARLQRPIANFFWPFVEAQAVFDLAVLSFDGQTYEEDDLNHKVSATVAPGVFLGGGIEFVGARKEPDPDRARDVRRPAVGYTARIGYVIMAPYSWKEHGSFAAGGLEFLHGVVVHF